MRVLSFFISIFFSISVIGADVGDYSRDLSIINEAVYNTFGLDSISIGGGTARSLILHIFADKPFEFRDFDLVIDAKQTVSAESAAKLGKLLEKSKLGKFSKENLRPRPRPNPALTDAKAANSYNAGFGFFVNSPQGIEYDISLFHSASDLSLNGIMDFDQFQIVLKRGQRLEDLINNPELFKRSLVDPQNAFIKLLKNQVPTVAVARWKEIAASPTMTSIRVVRTLAKFNGLPMDAFTKNRIKQLIQAAPAKDDLQIARNFLKLLEDPRWYDEYKALVEMGLFSKQFTSFAKVSKMRFNATETIDDKLMSIFEAADSEDSLKFLKLIADLEPELIQNLLPKLIALKKLNVGFYTGEFAPFHRGHEGVVNTVIQKKAVDLLFVIATPRASNDPKTTKFSPKEWAERRAFVKAGLNNKALAWSWPLPGINTENISTLDQTLKSLNDFVRPHNLMTHVFGMDSYHRVMARDLVIADPRPRIVVSRPGVPLPKDHVQKGAVTVLENIYLEPTSATRILHEVAVTGKSDYLSPEVIKLMSETPRYQKTIEDYKAVRDEAERLIPSVVSYNQKRIIWDVRENQAGLWTGETPAFGQLHSHYLKQLIALNPVEIVIPIYGNDTLTISRQKEWAKAIKKFNSPNIRIRTEPDDYSPNSEKVIVIHSGAANELLKKGTFVEYYGERALIIFETPDQPLSPLLKSLGNIRRLDLKVMQLRCESIFNAG